VNKRLLSVIGSVVVTAAGLMLAAQPAAASTPAYAWSPTIAKDTAGAAATCQFVVAKARSTAWITCTLSDTSADGDAVYVAWQSGYGGWRSIYNRNGLNTSFSFNSSGYTDGARTYQWKVCRDRQAPWTDNCSATYPWTRPA
jgi:hypothetical protein